MLPRERGCGVGTHLTFGAKRFEVVGGFVNAVLLLSLSFYVALDAIPRLFRPPVLDGSDEWVIIAAIGMCDSKQMRQRAAPACYYLNMTAGMRPSSVDTDRNLVLCSCFACSQASQ